jgi:hypothetical protein
MVILILHFARNIAQSQVVHSQLLCEQSGCLAIQQGTFVESKFFLAYFQSLKKTAVVNDFLQ